MLFAAWGSDSSTSVKRQLAAYFLHAAASQSLYRYPAKIAAVKGETYDIDYDDGEQETGVPAAAVRKAGAEAADDDAETVEEATETAEADEDDDTALRGVGNVSSARSPHSAYRQQPKTKRNIGAISATFSGQRA